MTVSKRFLVLCSKNVAQVPSAHGFHGPDQKGAGSPSFLTAASAKAFADFLAKRSVGQSYYLAEIQEGTVQYTEPVEPGAWTAATADAAE